MIPRTRLERVTGWLRGRSVTRALAVCGLVLVVAAGTTLGVLTTLDDEDSSAPPESSAPTSTPFDIVNNCLAAPTIGAPKDDGSDDWQEVELPRPLVLGHSVIRCAYSSPCHRTSNNLTASSKPLSIVSPRSA